MTLTETKCINLAIDSNYTCANVQTLIQALSFSWLNTDNTLPAMLLMQNLLKQTYPFW